MSPFQTIRNCKSSICAYWMILESSPFPKSSIEHIPRKLQDKIGLGSRPPRPLFGGVRSGYSFYSEISWSFALMLGPNHDLELRYEHVWYMCIVYERYLMISVLRWRYLGRIIFPKQNQTASAQLLTGQEELAISLEINPQPLFGGVGVLSILKLAGALHWCWGPTMI